MRSIATFDRRAGSTTSPRTRVDAETADRRHRRGSHARLAQRRVARGRSRPHGCVRRGGSDRRRPDGSHVPAAPHLRRDIRTATLVAKLGNGDDAARAKVAHGYASEVGFYTEIAPTVDVRTPRCWYGAIVDDKTRFTLVLDDVPDAAPLAQVDGCSVDQARSAVANLTGLHAARWNDETLLGHAFLMRPSVATASVIGGILVPATDGFIGRYERTTGPWRDRDASRGGSGDRHVVGGAPGALLHPPWRLPPRQPPVRTRPPMTSSPWTGRRPPSALHFATSPTSWARASTSG